MNKMWQLAVRLSHVHERILKRALILSSDPSFPFPIFLFDLPLRYEFEDDDEERFHSLLPYEVPRRPGIRAVEMHRAEVSCQTRAMSHDGFD